MTGSFVIWLGISLIVRQSSVFCFFLVNVLCFLIALYRFCRPLAHSLRFRQPDHSRQSFAAPQGYVELVSSNRIAGWACDVRILSFNLGALGQTLQPTDNPSATTVWHSPSSRHTRLLCPVWKWRSYCRNPNQQRAAESAGRVQCIRCAMWLRDGGQLPRQFRL